MAIIPPVDFIDAKLNTDEHVSLPRNYLGLSQVGHQCHRYLQYYHYWAFQSDHSARVSRLLNFGHLMEDHMIEDLNAVGIFVTGTQAEVIGTAGHWKGHCDGIGYQQDDPAEFLIEFKTHNDKSFKDMKKKGVQESKSVHYSQVQAYMGYLELGRCFYLAYSKNTSEYYYEWIDFNKEWFKESQHKEMEVIASDALLPRIGNNSYTWFECRFCDARDVCFEKIEPIRSCRTCVNVDVLDDGIWSCSLTDSALCDRQQKEGCDQYKLASMFSKT